MKYQKSRSKIKILEGMVDVSNKKETKRVAKAKAFVRLSQGLIKRIKGKKILKGDVFEQARIAGILAAKKTPDLIPMCHPLRLSEVKISFGFTKKGIEIISQVTAVERTGVEIEALVTCVISALTIYDMCKMYDRSIEIKDVMLLEKRGGKSGTFKRAKMES